MAADPSVPPSPYQFYVSYYTRTGREYARNFERLEDALAFFLTNADAYSLNRGVR